MTEKAHRAQLRKLHFALRTARKALPAHLPPLFALTDPVRTPDLETYANALPEGSGLIYRHFGLEGAYIAAKRLSKIARKRHLYLLIGNDPHLAIAVGANGVHWSQARLHEARRWKTRFGLQTGAAHSRQAVMHAADAGLDAALLSTVFPSKSPTASQPMGAHRFHKQARLSPIPLYALGGLHPENMQRVARSGGIAAIEGLQALSRMT